MLTVIVSDRSSGVVLVVIGLPDSWACAGQTPAGGPGRKPTGGQGDKEEASFCPDLLLSCCPVRAAVASKSVTITVLSRPVRRWRGSACGALPALVRYSDRER